MTLADRLRRWEEPLVLYEAVPPNEDSSEETAAHRATRVARLLADRRVDAINVPEIRVEAGDDSYRTRGELTKRDPREFGRRVADRIDGGVDVLVNHAVVHDPPAAQERWFEATYDEYGIGSVVVVGGGSSGIDFFTSQMVFDPEPVIRLLGDYDDVCRTAGVDPAPVFLSFAPLTCPRDARFLEGLGIDIPADIREWVLDSDGDTERRGVRAAERVLDEVLAAVRCDGLAVPVGINVGHVMRDNVEASGRLLDRLIESVEWDERSRPAEPDIAR